MNQKTSHDSSLNGTQMGRSNEERRSEQLDTWWSAIYNAPPRQINTLFAETLSASPESAPIYSHESQSPMVTGNASDTVLVPEHNQAPPLSESGAKRTPQVLNDDGTRAQAGVEPASGSGLDLQGSRLTATSGSTDPSFTMGDAPGVSSDIVPREYDVLYGRGKTHRKHKGNIRMQLLADIHRKAYLTAADRDDKTYITRRIVNIIKSSDGINSGRFLKFEVDQDCWVEVSDEDARKKVGHALRDGRSRQLRRIDPTVLEEILPLLSDEFKQVAMQMGSSDAALKDEGTESSS